MKWSPPRIECRFRLVSVRASFRHAIVASFLTSFFLSGCASIPAMTSAVPGLIAKSDKGDAFTAEEQARISAMPAIPEFDIEAPQVAEAQQIAVVTTSPAPVSPAPAAAVPAITEVAKDVAPVLASVAAATESVASVANTAMVSADEKSPKENIESTDVPKPVDPAPTAAKVDPMPETSSATSPQVASSESSGVKSTSANPATETKAPKQTENPVAAKSEPATSTDKTDVAMGGEGNRNSSTRSDGGLARKNNGSNSTPDRKAANAKPSGVVVKAPETFSWKPTGKSSGNRPFQVVQIGDEGYRTLVLGSVGGKDPLAIELVDRLARHLHQDSIILGGFECTIVRTMNPDGEATGKLRNQKGEYVNSGFPKSLADVSKVSMAEPKFVLEQIERLKPQRIVHIRSISSGVGVVATGFSSQTAAREAAEWMKFKMVTLPDKSDPGQLERYVSTSGVADMITIGIPESTPKDELWNLYGDTILNLLLAEDFATREVARKQ